MSTIRVTVMLFLQWGLIIINGADSRVLDDGPDGFYGSTHPVEKTLDEWDIVSVVNLVRYTVSRYLHLDVYGIPF